jgi:transcriptional regulator with XRE-family HTH domain/endogenous inhibitor of DNA gyrase (YacG/DUF329 family)
MVEFARLLGVSASAISQYESGKILPAGKTLLALMHYAEGAERPPLLKAVGIQALGAGMAGASSERELAEAMREVQRYIEQAETDGIPERDITVATAREVIAKEAARILSEERLTHPVVAQILRSWRTHGTMPGAERVFMDAAAYLEVQLRILESPVQAPSKPLRTSAADRRNASSFRVMIRCPQTGKPVFTGTELTRQQWDRTEFEGMRVNCPHCHSPHVWSKSNAYLEAVKN